MHAIKSKENFRQEVSGLIVKIKEQIDNYSNAVNTGSDLNSTEAIEKINVLKRYVLLLKLVPNELKEMDQKDWDSKKDGLQDTFQQANEALKEIIKKAA